jgi:hypothetical protein
MKQFVICILLVIGSVYGIHAQDKIVLRNGRTIEVHIQRSLENRVEYTYPGETAIYERPKSAISYILYEDGREEICDEHSRSSSARISSPDRSSANHTSSAGNKLSPDNKIFWQDVKTTFSETDVRGMTRLNRISALSKISYKDAIEQLKKKAATAGGTMILVLDVPENENDEAIEVIGIAYRDENMPYPQRSVGERTTTPAESSSNVRRRRIAQQMESYDNESNLQLGDDPDNRSQNTRSSSTRSASSSSRDKSASRQPSASDAQSDAVHLTNGRIIRGVIEEFEPDDFVSIRTQTGKIYEYSMDDVKRISRGVSTRNSGKTSAKQTSSRSASKSDNSDEYENWQSSYGDNNDSDAYRTSGYKGIFDAGYDFPLGGTGEKGNLEINTSHGLRINEFLFVGAGLGLHKYNARDPMMKNSEHYPQYVSASSSSGTIITPEDSVTYMYAVDTSYTTFPLFLDVRGYYPIANSAITPFAMFRIGYAFNLSDGFGKMGIYMNPAVGVKYQISPRIGINISIGYSYQNYGGIPANGGYGYYYYKSKADKENNTKYEAKAAGSISLKLGVEF